MDGWVAGFVGTWADAWTAGLRAETDRYRAALILKQVSYLPTSCRYS